MPKQIETDTDISKEIDQNVSDKPWTPERLPGLKLWIHGPFVSECLPIALGETEDGIRAIVIADGRAIRIEPSTT